MSGGTPGEPDRGVAAGIAVGNVLSRTDVLEARLAAFEARLAALEAERRPAIPWGGRDPVRFGI